MALCDDSHANDATYVPAWRIGYLVHHHCSLPVQWIHGIKCCLGYGSNLFNHRNHPFNLDLEQPLRLGGMGFDQLGSKQHRERQHHHDVHAGDDWKHGFFPQFLLL